MLREGLQSLKQENTRKAYQAILRTIAYGKVHTSPMSTIYRLPTSYGTFNVLEVAWDGEIRIRGAGVDRCLWDFEVPRQSQLHHAIMSVCISLTTGMPFATSYYERG